MNTSPEELKTYAIKLWKIDAGGNQVNQMVLECKVVTCTLDAKDEAAVMFAMELATNSQQHIPIRCHICPAPKTTWHEPD